MAVLATAPPSARRHYAASRLIAQRAVSEAMRMRGRRAALVNVIVGHQVMQAVQAETAVGAMLADQNITAPPVALLNPAAFTTSQETISTLLEQINSEWQFARLVGSIVQDAGRAAESVAVTARPRTGYVRLLSPPSCSRCAVLAGRVYRFSTGFQRHPYCDCVMVPTSEQPPDDLVTDPVTLLDQGQVTGLSKADMQAIKDGADFNQIVNVRRSEAGLHESGRVVARRGRLTPEGIYRRAGDNRAEALRLLRMNGYIIG